MKIAVAHWQGRISPVFDVSHRLCVIEIAEGRELRRDEATVTSVDPFERAKEVAELGICILLCGAVSHVLERALACAGIKVIGFLCGDMESVIAAYCCGRLTGEVFMMPGCCGKRGRLRFRGCRNKDL